MNTLNNNHDFDKIISTKNEIDKIILYITEISSKLKEHYSELVHNNKSKLSLFGIDSLFFQNKLIDYEFKNYNELLDFITNKMYCEYYKLYKLILKYIEENLTDKNTVQNIKTRDIFPIYKDLEIYKKYDFQIINDIHQEVYGLFNILQKFLNEKKQRLVYHQEKNNLGLNINNFVNTFNFEINSFEQQTQLFYNYLEFFHSLHIKHLSRFLTKIEVFYLQINNDININTNNVDKKNMINEIINNNTDKNLRKPLRKSLSIKTNNTDLSYLSDNSFNEDINVNSIKNMFHDINKNNDVEHLNTIINQTNNSDNVDQVDDSDDVEQVNDSDDVDQVNDSDDIDQVNDSDDVDQVNDDLQSKLVGLSGNKRRNVKKRIKRKSLKV